MRFEAKKTYLRWFVAECGCCPKRAQLTVEVWVAIGMK